ncbi:DUF4436 domain-containing protein [Mycobacterium parmense]|uniref:DUF4436 domain-containing protein n=1 Tax=Mycobacterium parmense TaxID=185642 RepID=A0A7I7YYC2_9MYCO|nr:DUF4436 domain-containing protein [Mycobacterium parmense]MCV7350842.1 DUF4436 domain-containing protein [Mycobacterium parmense]ORW48521.1 hypothetical protein AWC20_26775 [Mycobacterium parmense]BBZ45731.1 DUF4436 domain-containing protein [Mycobacterium parmense]
MRTAVTRFGIVSLVVVIVGAYAASLMFYARSSSATNVFDGPAGSDGTTATLSVEEMQPNYSAVVANLAVLPGPALLDPLTHRLKEDLTLRVRSAAAPTHREYTRGMLPGVFPVPLTLAGHLERWPFDHYRSGPIEVQLFHGGGTTPELVPVTFVDHLSGWQVGASKPSDNAPYRLNLRRAPSTAAFAIVVIGVLVTIAVLALFVAIQTVRDRRKFQPPMTTWYGAMLFAVVPLRNALPGSPPFGSWIDLTVVIWVLVALAVAMSLYISCWWRHLRPDADKPA